MEQTGNSFVDALRQEQTELQNRLGMIDQLVNSYTNDPHNYRGGNQGGFQGASGGNRGNQQGGTQDFGNIRGSREINRSFSQNTGGGFSGGSNQGRQGFSGGQQGGGNISGGKGDDASQRVTKEGRQEHDADDVDPQQLNNWLRNPDQSFMNQDGSYDRRTKEGRALYAAGLIDDEGMPVGKGGNVTDIGSSRR